MARVRVEDVLRDLDRPLEPRPEFADALLAMLELELDASQAEESSTRERELRVPKSRQRVFLRRPALAGAVAVALAILIAGIPLLLRPDTVTALAAIQEARQKFKDLPSFHAVTERIRPGDVLGEHLGRDVPDERVVSEIFYASDSRWRREQVKNSWDELGNPALLQDRPGGSYQVADGRLIADYNPLTQRFTVGPIDEQRPIDLRREATGNLAPEPWNEFLDFGSEFFEESCTLLEETKVLGRTATHIRCSQQGSSFETWLDKQTGLVLSYRNTEGTLFRVKSIEFNATFPPNTFDVVAPRGAAVQWTGEQRPPRRFRVMPDPEVAAVIAVGAAPSAIAYGHGSIWVGGLLEGRRGPSAVMRIDPATNDVVATIPTDGATSLVAAGGYIWVGIAEGAIQRIDPATNRASESVRIGGFPSRLAYGDGSLWFLGGSDDESRPGETPKGSIARLNPTTGHVTATIRIPGLPWGEPSAGFGSMWVPVMTPREFQSGEYVTLSVHRVDTATNQVIATIDLEAPGWVVGAFESGVWVPNQYEDRPVGTVTRIDPATNRVGAVIPVGHMPGGVVEAAGFIWVMNQGDDTITKIDPTTNQALGEITVGAGPSKAVFVDGYLWVTNNLDGTVARVKI